MDVVFHYPPELVSLLIETIPRLCKSKQDTLLFFQGAGMPRSLMQDLYARLESEPDAINKFGMVRTLVARLNEKGDGLIAERRQVLRRVVEFEAFDACWPNDRLKARGLVAEIRELVGARDYLTRLQQYHEMERQKHQANEEEKLNEKRLYKQCVASIRDDLFGLFADRNAQRRGKALEGVLNRFFGAAGILIHEAFTVTGASGEGVVAQIDGAVTLDHHVYLVETKWWAQPLGKDEVSSCLIDIYNRGHARGIFLSASGYTEPAISVCRDALQRTVVVLCTLEEVVQRLEREDDIKEWLRKKVEAAILHKNPLFDPFANP